LRAPGEVGKIILKWILKKFDVTIWTRFIWFRDRCLYFMNMIMNLWVP